MKHHLLSKQSLAFGPLDAGHPKNWGGGLPHPRNCGQSTLWVSNPIAGRRPISAQAYGAQSTKCLCR